MHKDIEVYNIKTSARMTREKFHSIMKNQYTLYIEYARDAEYLEYMLQRFHNTPEEFKNDNIPINFKKEILD
jgi:hypothetical protein